MSDLNVKIVLSLVVLLVTLAGFMWIVEVQFKKMDARVRDLKSEICQRPSYSELEAARVHNAHAATGTEICSG